MITYGTFASGIEAPSVAWEGLGFQPAYFSEIARFPSAVLKYRFPDVPNLGDMTQAHQTKVFQNESVNL